MARSPIMILDKLPAIAGLSIEDKWTLAAELWDEVSERQQELPTNQTILDVVEQRFADYERDPSTAMTLEEFKRKFRLT
jgi:putative addiction module component (TIGR02574 family)